MRSGVCLGCSRRVQGAGSVKEFWERRGLESSEKAYRVSADSLAQYLVQCSPSKGPHANTHEWFEGTLHVLSPGLTRTLTPKLSNPKPESARPLSMSNCWMWGTKRTRACNRCQLLEFGGWLGSHVTKHKRYRSV